MSRRTPRPMRSNALHRSHCAGNSNLRRQPPGWHDDPEDRALFVHVVRRVDVLIRLGRESFATPPNCAAFARRFRREKYPQTRSPGPGSKPGPALERAALRAFVSQNTYFCHRTLNGLAEFVARPFSIINKILHFLVRRQWEKSNPHRVEWLSAPLQHSVSAGRIKPHI